MRTRSAGVVSRRHRARLLLRPVLPAGGGGARGAGGHGQVAAAQRVAAAGGADVGGRLPDGRGLESLGSGVTLPPPAVDDRGNLSHPGASLGPTQPGGGGPRAGGPRTRNVFGRAQSGTMRKTGKPGAAASMSASGESALRPSKKAPV